MPGATSPGGLIAFEPFLRLSLGDTIHLVHQTKVVGIENAREEDGMLRVKKRSGVLHCESRLGKIEQRAGPTSNVVPRRIEKPRGFRAVIAQSRGPALSYRMRTSEQAGVRTDAGETPRRGEIYEPYWSRKYQVGKMALVESSSRHCADSRGLAKCLDEGAVQIHPNVQHPETGVRRVKPVPAGPAEKNRPPISIMDAREGHFWCQLIE